MELWPGQRFAVERSRLDVARARAVVLSRDHKGAAGVVLRVEVDGDLVKDGA